MDLGTIVVTTNKNVLLSSISYCTCTAVALGVAGYQYFWLKRRFLGAGTTGEFGKRPWVVAGLTLLMGALGFFFAENMLVMLCKQSTAAPVVSPIEITHYIPSGSGSGRPRHCRNAVQFVMEDASTHGVCADGIDHGLAVGKAEISARYSVWGFVIDSIGNTPPAPGITPPATGPQSPGVEPNRPN